MREAASLLCLLLVGCESVTAPHGLLLKAVDPETWTLERFEETVTIYGEDLFLGVYADVAGERRVEQEFRATLGNVALPSVTWISNTELEAETPAELPEGVYDLTVIARDGRRGVLRDAVRVQPFEGELAAWSDMGDSVPVDDSTDTSASGGGISNSPEAADQPALALETGNHPIVAWTEHLGNASHIYVARHDGTTWIELDGSLTGVGVSGAGVSTWPSLALDDTELPLLAYQSEVGGKWQVHVQRYEETWQALAATSLVADGQHPALVASPIGVVVAWQGASSIQAARLDTGAWVGLSGGGTGVSDSTGGENPSLAVRGSGVVLAFDMPGSHAARQIVVREWDGSWSDISGSPPGGDGVSGTPGDSLYPAILVQDSGAVVVAWQDASLAGGTEIFAARSNTPGVWQPIGRSLPQTFGGNTGGISDTLGNSRRPSVASAGDVLIVAWQQGARVLAAEFSDTYTTDWTSPQGLIDGVVYAGESPVATPRVAMNAHSRPTVVWTHGLSQSQIYLARRSCQLIWEELVVGAQGGVSGTGACAEAPSVAIDSELRPTVAWHQGNVPYRPEDDWHIYLRELRDGAWRERVGSGSGAGLSNMEYQGAGFPDLVIDTSDEPWVAYSQWFGGWRWEVLVRHPYMGAWVGIDGSGDSPGLSDHVQPSLYPSLAVDPAGELQVAWQQYTAPGQNDLAFAYHQPGSWSRLGNPSDGAYPWYPSLAVDSTGDPVLAWHEVEGPSWSVQVKRWQSDRWVGMGGGGSQVSTKGRSGPVVLVLNDADEPVVAWQQARVAGPRQIHLAAWRAITGAWTEVSGSQGLDGISQTTGESIEPDLVLDHEQQPVVAWADNSSGNWEILVHRHNGSSWGPIPGSEANVSNTRGSSRQPSLAFRDRRLCVAWAESGTYGTEIAVRCIDL